MKKDTYECVFYVDIGYNKAVIWNFWRFIRTLNKLRLYHEGSSTTSDSIRWVILSCFLTFGGSSGIALKWFFGGRTNARTNFHFIAGYYINIKDTTAYRKECSMRKELGSTGEIWRHSSLQRNRIPLIENGSRT